MAAPGWTDTYDADTDWTSVEFVNMFIRAHNERMNAAAQSSLVISEIADGSTDIDRVSIWGTLSTNVINQAAAFVRPTIDPTSVSVNTLDSSAVGKPNRWGYNVDPLTWATFTINLE